MAEPVLPSPYRFLGHKPRVMLEVLLRQLGLQRFIPSGAEVLPWVVEWPCSEESASWGAGGLISVGLLRAVGVREMEVSVLVEAFVLHYIVQSEFT